MKVRSKSCYELRSYEYGSPESKRIMFRTIRLLDRVMSERGVYGGGRVFGDSKRGRAATHLLVVAVFPGPSFRFAAPFVAVVFGSLFARTL